MEFADFLRSRLATGGFTTEDVLSSFLPLLRQVIQAHERGQVAPLEGLAAIHVEGVQLWLAEADLQAPAQNLSQVETLERTRADAVEILRETRLTHDVTDGDFTAQDLSIGDAESVPSKPLYLPGYVCWELRVSHHDPLTDTFSLGMILASLGCGLDVGDPEDLQRFVAQRGNLFDLNPELHPVLARIIVRMTELRRDRRPQDLPSLLKALENYRDQPVDFEVDLASAAGFQQQDRSGKQRVILGKLQERLFEISRRNRLLEFKPTLQSVNLTHASVPLSFDPQSLRPDQIFVWNSKLHDLIAAGRVISLNSHLNFREAAYLPNVLDRIRIDAVRDRAEYGFAQLRLVACMLRWADLKASPPAVYRSPLVLIPVELRKQKGIRDTWSLEPQETVTEINPVVRHLFQQLYAIELPESLDLTKSTLDDLHQMLSRAIEASEPAVSLKKVDRPRIELIHQQARRRLDQYVRRARLYGRGVRSFMDVEYSYDPVNYHPLGLKLYSEVVRPAISQLEAVLGESASKRQFAVAPDEPPAAVAEQRLYSLREEEDVNPFTWEFDLCSLTLGNFRYRKMSLVRDYASLLKEPVVNPAFESSFSLEPRPVEDQSTAPLSLEQRYHVVPCDPTQAAAVEESRSGRSYIIQGPPGTGKSQTIANLIADYVACGRRVLFVCEKRAAIDVVFHRLQQQQLDRLCCLIHDSQSDKREFVMDLKRTYEENLEAESTRRKRKDERSKLTGDLQDSLAVLQHYHDAMSDNTPRAGLATRELLARLILLRDDVPKLSPLEWEEIPDYHAVDSSRDSLERLEEGLARTQASGLLARHPLRWLSANVAAQERPLDFAGRRLGDLLSLVPELLAKLQDSGLPSEHWQNLEQVLQLVEHADSLVFLASRELSELLRSDSQRAKAYRKGLKRVGQLSRTLQKKQTDNPHWRQKLAPDVTAAALDQARRFAADTFRFLKPAWWRLRSVLRQAYDFAAHPIRPSWVDVLGRLSDEHGARAEWEATTTALADELEIDEPLSEFDDRLNATMQRCEKLDGSLKSAHAALLTLPDADQRIQHLAKCRDVVRQTLAALDGFMDHIEGESLPSVVSLLQTTDAALKDLPAYLPVLGVLGLIPEKVAEALRKLPLTRTSLEAAAAVRTWNSIADCDRALEEFSHEQRESIVARLEMLTRRWLKANAETICQRVRETFLNHVRISTTPAGQLSAEEKVLQRQYARGRRELEHEFGKTMRYKSIRDLVSGDSGIVVRDLKPVWLMSPLSVADTLPLAECPFDVVIFDEASQITLEEAVPCLFRASQTIVVGDQMQLPPTSFFATKQDDEEGISFAEETGEVVQYDLEADSFLNHAARNLPSRMLGWHYRSRSESLISFSNGAFYQGRLLTVPDESSVGRSLPELIVSSAEDGRKYAAELSRRPIGFHCLQHGVYDQRRNRPEAEYIAELVRGLLLSESHPTVGIIAFSEAQQAEIQAALERLADDDRPFRECLEVELEREEDGQFAGLLVKNLENIQGDERDVVILSVCYGPDPQGRMRMNFGPINQSGGERRLNVAFSRAKHHMSLVTSIRSTAITNEYNVGANCLKNYLAYAEASSRGDTATVERILRSLAPVQESGHAEEAEQDPVVDQLADALEQRGYVVHHSIGQSHFRCDLAVLRPGEAQYRLGILVDTSRWYAQTDLLEREVMKPGLLKAFGWTITVVLTKDWWTGRDQLMTRLVALIEQESPQSGLMPETPGRTTPGGGPVEQEGGGEESAAHSEGD